MSTLSDNFDSIIGNLQAKKYLASMAEKQAIGQLLLFSGIDGIGKSLFAENLAKWLLNRASLVNHPDFHVYRPEGKLGVHSIESMRAFCEKVYLPPFLANRKVFIIHSAERMQQVSANALLKTFEEPHLDTLIILLSSNQGALLRTILSRCRILRFLPIEIPLIAQFLMERCGKGEEEAEKIASLSSGSTGKAFRFSLKQDDPIRKNLLTFLSNQNVKLYSEVIETAKTISDSLDEGKSYEEETTKNLLLENYAGELTALEMQHIAKEAEGAAAIYQAEFALRLFEQILSWYRDIHLLKANGDTHFLMNPDFFKELEVEAKGNSIPLEIVQKIVKEAKLLLERSTSLNIVLENLFLKLGLL